MDLERKLRIAMLGHKRFSREGGVEVVVEELSTRMVGRGHHVTCYNRSGHHVSGKEFDSENKKDYKGVRLIYVPTVNRRGLAAMTSSIAGAFLCAIGRYDAVHFHAEGPCALLWLPKLFGKKCICTIHGLDWQRAKWGHFASLYIKLGERCAVKFADEIIVLSESVQTYFKDTYGRETVFVPNGVSRPEIKAVDVIEHDFGLKKDQYLLYLGRIVPEKGLPYLLDAFKQVKTDMKLVIAGGSSDTEWFTEKMKAHAAGDERVVFTGFIQGQHLRELYSNAYIFVLPSDLEGMPLTLLEALSYGNCCLVSNIAECVEVVEDKSLVFEKANVEDLKEKLQYACDRQDVVRGYKEQAADFVCAKYDWDEVVERTLQIYGGK